MTDTTLAPEHDDTIDETHVSRNTTIGIIGDIHYTDADADILQSDLADAATHFHDADVDRIIFIGDLITETDSAADDTHHITAITRAFDTLDAPLTTVVGNHDAVNLAPHDVVTIGTDTNQITRDDPAHAFYTFTMTPSITGIVLDSSYPQHDDARGHVSQDQLDWLDTTLDTVDNAVIFVHHPVHYHALTDDSWFTEHPEVAFAQNKFEVTNILDDYTDTVLSVFNGHTHFYNYTQYHGIDHFTAPAINYAGPDNTDPNGLFSIVDISETRTRYRVFQRDFPDPVETQLVTQTNPDDTVVALGGTFDPVHDGHRELFRRAFELGDLVVGLTSDDLAPRTRHEERFILPFEERKNTLDSVLSNLSTRHDRDYRIAQLDDPTGVAGTDPSITHLIASPETVARALTVNDERETHDLDPITVEVVEPKRADDGGVLSSTRICKGEIDPHGNLTPNANGREPIQER